MFQHHPYIEVTEQPKQRGMRFRYECEGRSAGSIPGDKTTQDRKSWPTVQIKNYRGEVTIRVSLVSKGEPPRPHPHSLVGKDCENGICSVRVSPETQMTACFSNLGIQCVKRKEVADALRERRRLGVDPYETFKNKDTQSVDIDLNIVRLCFEAFLMQGSQQMKLRPVVSHEIYDKKATCSSMLRICRVDKSYGSCKGGDEVYLLCDKVQKDDISICFSHESGWESYGEFSPTDVHRQVAIVFRTPPFKSQNIREATKVMFRLKRISDEETSEPKDFIYLPLHHDQPQLQRKRTFPQATNDQRAALRNYLREKIPTPMGRQPRPAPYPQGPYPIISPPSQFPDDIFRRQPPPIGPAVPSLPGDKILDQFLKSRFQPTDPGSSYSTDDMQGGSSQFSASAWMQTPEANPLPVDVAFPSSATPHYFGPEASQSPSTSMLTGTRLPTNYGAGTETSIDKINPTFDAQDLTIPSIDSLKNVSFDPALLDVELKNLSIEEITPQYVKPEPMENQNNLFQTALTQADHYPNQAANMQFPGASGFDQVSQNQNFMTGAQQYQSPSQPNGTLSTNLQVLDYEPTTFPSFDLSDPQGQYSLEGNQTTDIDDLVASENN